jgi:hypothetical protein
LHPLASKTGATLVPFERVTKLVGVESVVLLFVVLFDEELLPVVVEPPVIALTVALTQRLFWRMNGKLQRLQVFPSELQLAQKMFLIEQRLHTPLATKYPKLHRVQATLERQVLHPI